MLWDTMSRAYIHSTHTFMGTIHSFLTLTLFSFFLLLLSSAHSLFFYLSLSHSQFLWLFISSSLRHRYCFTFSFALYSSSFSFSSSPFTPHNHRVFSPLPPLPEKPFILNFVDCYLMWTGATAFARCSLSNFAEYIVFTVVTNWI